LNIQNQIQMVSQIVEAGMIELEDEVWALEAGL
jgi:hypothetical protein